MFELVEEVTVVEEQPFKSERAFQQRLDFHLFAAAIWGNLAKEAMTMLSKETYLGHRSHYEAFIDRQLGAWRGGASERFVAQFLDGGNVPPR